MDIFKAKEHTKDLFAGIRRTADTWRIIALVLLVSNIVLAAGLSLVASQKRVIPYIVQVDSHGYEVAVKPAQEISTVDDRVVIARIGTFVERLRTVISDVDGQKSLIKWVYSSIPNNSKALTTTNQFYRERSPFKLATLNRTVRAEVKSVLSIAPNVWRAEWIETEFLSGVPQKEERWTGLFTIGITPTKDMSSIIRNPLGIYVTEYTTTQSFN